MQSAPKLIAFAATAAIAAGLSGGVSVRADKREQAAEDRWPAIGTIVEVDGTPVHAYVTGSGPDLVLIHGAGGNVRDFTFDLVEMLSPHYRVVALDRPGHGYTGHPASGPSGKRTPSGESPAVQAKLLQAAARQLGVQSPIVLGHSFGGSVAMAWALDFPDDVAALVLLAGATMPWPGRIKASYHINASALGGATVVPLIAAFATEAQAEEVLDFVFAPQPVPAGYAEHFGLPLSMRRDTLRSNARQVAGLYPHVVEMSKRYAALDLPIELVHGDRDTIVPVETHSGPLSEVVSGANLTVLAGVGHMPHHANPEDVLQAVNRAAVRAGLRRASGPATP